ncbi:YcaO-like family protein [Streptomyces sp. LARHCF252]
MDPRVGVVKSIDIVRSDICPTLIRAYADLSVYTDDTDLSDKNGSAVRVAEKCGGKGFIADDALVGALGEAIERYSAALPPAEVHSARAEDLEGDVLDPSKLVLYGSRQYARPGFPYRHYDPRAHYPWVQGEWLDGTGDVWLPANLVYYTPPGREALAQVTTNGLAAGCGWEDASCRATLELIERDAFLRMWITRTAPVRLDLDGVDSPAIERVARLVRDLQAHDLALGFYLLPAAGDVTVVLCLGLGDGRQWPGAIVGTAASVDPRSAVEKAALEQAYTALYLRDVLASGRRLPKSDAEVRTFLDHALRYAGAGTRRRLSFMVDTTRTVRLSDLPGTGTSGQVSLRELVVRLGVPVAIADVTAGDVAATGVRVVRALSPDLQPLHCGTGLERLGRRQLFRGAGRLYTKPHPMC